MTNTAQPTLASRLTHITRNTLLVTFLFGLAAVAGLFRNIIVAQEFGIGAALDAYYAAFKLPDLLFAVVAGGALATAFIPIFADFLTDGDRPGAWRLAAAITNLVVIVTGVLASIAWIFAPWLVSTLIAPGFPPPAQAETVQVMRIVLFSTVLFGISAVQGSALNGFKHFFLPALAPVVYPLGIAAGAILLAPTMGVTGLAIGAVFGSLLHLLIKVPGLIKFGYQWWPVLDLKSQAVRRVLVLLGPRVLDLFVFQFTLIMTTNLASRLGAGGVSSVEWGWDAMQLPETLIGTAFGLVAFPTMAELAARRDIAGLRSTLGETLRWVIALALPATVGLILLGRPLLSFLYQRGQFDAAAVDAVYTTLRFFALGLVAQTCLELTARAFFAQKDTVTPLIVATGSAVTNILLAILLMGVLGAGGLALANTLAVTAEVLVLMVILRKRWGSVEGRLIGRTLLRAGLASAVMGLVIVAFLGRAEAAGLGSLPLVALGGLLGVVVYVVAGLLFGVRELRELPHALLGR